MLRRILLPLLLTLAGLLAGLGAGQALRSEIGQQPENEADRPETDDALTKPATTAPAEFVTLENQFIIPILKGGRVVSLVAMSLGLEVGEGEKKLIFAREPRLRDSFLQVMFDHANAGGFDGPFTEGARLATLRNALVEAARAILGPALHDVLITEIGRQDG